MHCKCILVGPSLLPMTIEDEGQREVPFNRFLFNDLRNANYE
ncbi:hypothetical protein BA6E_101202 [Bacteroidales bacterium 6E]|nr:hypothetical protein BA6E_101202 [Bacteroidales bacterium 6E]